MANESSGSGGVGGSSDGASFFSTGDDTSAEADVGEEAEQIVHYYFPVEVEVRSASADVDLDHIVAETLRRLTESIRGA